MSMRKIPWRLYVPLGDIVLWNLIYNQSSPPTRELFAEQPTKRAADYLQTHATIECTDEFRRREIGEIRRVTNAQT